MWMVKRIDVLTFLKEGGEKETIKERFGWILYQKKPYVVRILAAKLPEKKAKEARKRKQRKASKNQYKLKNALVQKQLKKTLSIPEWLNEEATSMGINFSQVLQEALISKLQIK